MSAEDRVQTQQDSESSQYRLRIGDDFFLIATDSPGDEDPVSRLVNNTVKVLGRELNEKLISIHQRKGKARKKELDLLREQAQLIRDHIRILKGEMEGSVSLIKSGIDSEFAGIRITDNHPIKHIKHITVKAKEAPVISAQEL